MSSDTDASEATYLTAPSSREDSPADALSSAFGSLRLQTARPAKVRVLTQDACRKHKYARDSDTYGIVERPERLRAINIGIAAAWARRGGDAALAVAAQVDSLSLGSSRQRSGVILSGAPFEVVSSVHRMPLLSTAVAFVHSEANKAPPSDSDSTPAQTIFSSQRYPEQLSDWIRDSSSAHAAGKSEVPSHLPQGDLYLCPGSLDAVEGALGTTCAAVDEAFNDRGTRFAAIRPPGHHCGTGTPSGFCLVNNVLVGAAHAHEKYDCDRAIIFDIDLHHGDGTQDIVHRINLESEAASRATRSTHTSPRRRMSSPHRGTSEKTPAKEGLAPSKRPLKLLYTSLHDIESFPCEDGDDDKITNASMRISGGHGHFICNVHLENYENEADFHAKHYIGYRDTLFSAAKDFLVKTSADSSRTLIIISAGFDASEHETPFMQRHGKRVPTSFFARFAADAQAFAAEYASDRMVAILEGGYSDRALISGMASFLDGCLGHSSSLTTAWDVKTLTALERACEGKGPSTRGGNAESWLTTAQSAFCALEGASLPGTSSTSTTPRELRERKAKPQPILDDTTPTRRIATKGKINSDPASMLPVPNGLPSSEPAPPVAEKDPSLPTPAIGKIRLTYKAAGIE